MSHNVGTGRESTKLRIKGLYKDGGSEAAATPITVLDETESDDGDESLNNAKATNYAIKEELEEDFDE